MNHVLARALGWSPAWFGCLSFGAQLEMAIAMFQTANGLEVDGVCGPETYRWACLDRDEDIPEPTAATGDCILHDGKRLQIGWDQIVTPDEPGALVIPRKNKRRVRWRPRESFDKAIIHWDVTRSPAKTCRVLTAAGISSHFCIGPEGVIYQMVDTANECFHAGIGWINKSSVGIDLNCRVKFKEGSDRPTMRGYSINGWRPKLFLGMYPVQIQALQALLQGLSEHLGLELEAPAYLTPKKLHSVPKKKVVPGVYHHAEVDYPRGRKRRRSGKWDTAGVDLREVCNGGY